MKKNTTADQGLIRLMEACRRLDVPYSTAYANIHKIAEPFGITIINSRIFCNENKITAIQKQIRGYVYCPDEKRSRNVAPWVHSRDLMSRGYILIGCFGFVKRKNHKPEKKS